MTNPSISPVTSSDALTVESLIEDRFHVDSSQPISAARELFLLHPRLGEVPVTRAGKVVGRLALHELLSVVDDAQSVASIMTSAVISVLRDHKIANLIQEISEDLFKPIPAVYAVVDTAGYYVGRFDTTRLLRFSAPRMASHKRGVQLSNSGLPGEQALLEKTREILQLGQLFVVASLEITGQDAFTSRYGAKRGNDVIHFVTDLVHEHLDSNLDFAAHLGKGCFVALLRSIDWFDRCEALISACEAQAANFYDVEERNKGGIEQYNYIGERHFSPIFSLSITVTQVEPTKFHSAEELLSQANKLRSRSAGAEGGTIFVEGFSHDAIKGTLGLVQH